MASFYKLRRDLHEAWFEKHQEYLLWWADLMYHAAWKSETVSCGNILVTIHRGEQIASINDLVQRWHRGKDMIIKFLKVLQEKGLIRKITRNNITIISIIDYDLEDDTDNPLDGKADNLADNLKHNQNTDKQRLSKKSRDSQADNLADNPLDGKTDNKADNLADNPIIYKEERIKKPSSTRAREGDDGSPAGQVDDNSLPEISFFIKHLLSDTDALWRIVRETGFSINDVKLWIYELGRKWEFRKPHEDYGDFLRHILGTLKIKSKKKEKPNQIYVENFTAAQTLWTVVQADLILNDSTHVQIYESLEFYDLKQNEKSEKELILIAPTEDIKDVVKNELVGKIKESLRIFTTSHLNVKCGTESKEK